jgi:hypothetical protein
LWVVLVMLILESRAFSYADVLKKFHLLPAIDKHHHETVG